MVKTPVGRKAAIYFAIGAGVGLAAFVLLPPLLVRWQLDRQSLAVLSALVERTRGPLQRTLAADDWEGTRTVLRDLASQARADALLINPESNEVLSYGSFRNVQPLPKPNGYSPNENRRIHLQGIEMVQVVTDLSSATNPRVLLLRADAVPTGHLIAVAWACLPVYAVVLSLVVILGFRLVVRHQEFVNGLLNGIRAISRKQYGTEIRVDSHGRMGLVDASFNRMSRQLREEISALETNRQRLEALLRGMDAGVLAISNEEKVLFANRAARVLLQYHVADPVQRPFWEVVRNLEFQQVIRSSLSNGTTTKSEIETPGPEKRILLMQINQLPQDSEPGVLVLIQDVSHLRQLEQLRQEFVANVSHELKTPLTSISAYAETLLDGALADPENNRAFVERISEQADRLSQLIMDLIKLAQLESGDEQFQLRPTRFAEKVQKCLNEFKPRAAEKQISIECDLSSQGYVAADEEALRNIFDNLIDNAIKYSPEGTVIQLVCRESPENVTLEVIDRGPGIPVPDQQRIFERFYRIDKARSRELGGTGLGLSIVKHTVSALGGTVAVDSEPGKGSNFRVTLPKIRPS